MPTPIINHPRTGTRRRLIHLIPVLSAFLVLLSNPTLATAIELPASPPTEEAPKAPPIERLATIGASATAGFGTYFWRYENGQPVRDSTTLAKFIRAASNDQLVVTDLGTAQFFTNPAGIGSLIVTRALRSRPDLVIGIDFLFWFCYGSIGIEARPMRTPEARMAMLEEGLRLLEQVVAAKIPLVVGDIPDMSAAQGRILQRGQVPPESVRLEANRRIQAWVAARPTVELFSLDQLQTLLSSDDPIEVDGVRLGENERARLLQSDRLHPTVGGLTVMIANLDEVLDRHPSVGSRMPEIDVNYGNNIERLTGFRTLGEQDPIDQVWRESRRTAEVDPTTGTVETERE